MADPGEGTLSGEGRPLRVLFVCTQNRLRSPTAEVLFRTHPDWEVASAGTARDADTPLSRDLLEWADVAVCMEKGHRDRTSLEDARRPARRPPPHPGHS